MHYDTYIYLVKNDILIVEKDIHAINHHHHAIQVLIQSEKSSSIIFNDKTIHHNTLIFDADKIHSLQSFSNWLIILLINPESKLGNHIRNKFLMHKELFSTDLQYSSHLMNHFKEFSSKSLSDIQILHIYDELINAISGVPTESFQLDERIEKIIEEINQMEEKNISVTEVASIACLSESRFMHLFKEEVKIPLRQFLAWIRMIEAIKLLVRGKTLTEAAMESGFTDLPHMHKTFKHFFGVKISDYIKDSRFIQVVEEDSA